jgi:hypothetical protein
MKKHQQSVQQVMSKLLYWLYCVEAWRDKGVFDASNAKRWAGHPDDQLWVNRELRAIPVPFKILPRELYPNGVFIPGFQKLTGTIFTPF